MRGNGSTRGRVLDSLVEQLGHFILDGTWAPGERLPNEAELGTTLGVSRTSLREAVKYLSAKGMIEARPRIGMIVREREAWNLLDRDVLAWQHGVGHAPDTVRSLLEARKVIEPAAAALAAERATAVEVGRIEEAYLRMAHSLPGDIPACCAADLDFHVAVLAASHNLVFRQLAGTISAALEALFQLSTSLSTTYADTLDAHRLVMEAIRLRDPAAARSQMSALLDLAQHDLEPALTDEAAAAAS